jgi:quercetin dioxygenase-like cupin family protein
MKMLLPSQCKLFSLPLPTRFMNHPKIVNLGKGRIIMGIVKQSAADIQSIAEGRTRFLAQTDRLMTAVIDFRDGPTSEPDPPHSHPHEQITYVAEGEILFCIGQEKHHLCAGDLFTVPGNVPHSVQLLTGKVRLVDTFTPIREDFL